MQMLSLPASLYTGVHKRHTGGTQEVHGKKKQLLLVLFHMLMLGALNNMPKLLCEIDANV